MDLVSRLKDPRLFRQQAYVDGAWVDADGRGTVDVDDPATGRKIGTVPDMGAAETRRAIMLSDYMYAMAALPLALEPIQRIRFLPYSHQRFHRFLDTWHAEFGDD